MSELTEISPVNQQLTWEEVDEFGTRLDRLKVGAKFVNVVCDPEWMKFVEIVGTVVHVGVGSITVEFVRGTKPDRCVWAPETMVIPVDLTN